MNVNGTDTVAKSGGHLALERSGLIDLVVDVWRIRNRAVRNKATPENVCLACDTALARLNKLGFRIEEHVGEAYHENSRMCVVDHSGGDENRRVVECLTPAVYYRDELIKPAEIVTEGEDTDGKADS